MITVDYPWFILTLTLARPCDKYSNFLDDDEPRPQPQLRDPTDWTPFTSHVQFETAEFLFQKAKMSAGNIDELLKLWADGSESPFVNHQHLYETIDAIPVGGVPWQQFNISYNGECPKSDVPPWMEQSYEVYFRDPHALLLDMLENPTFVDDFDYAPQQQFTSDGTRQYEHFMSGNWAWKQAVRASGACFDNRRSLILYA